MRTMPDDAQEQSTNELPNVVDGQSVVDSVYEDTSLLIDNAVRSLEETIVKSGEGQQASQSISEDQWQQILSYQQLTATLGFMAVVGVWCVAGAVLGALVVRGWRRG